MSPVTAITAALLVVLLIWTLGTVTTGPVAPVLVTFVFGGQDASDEMCFCYDHLVDCSSRSKTILLPEHICDDNPIFIDISKNSLTSAGVSCLETENGTLFCEMPTVFVEDVEVFLVHENQLETFSAYGDAYTRLRILNLSSNRISNAHFESLDELEILDFSFNNLTTVPWSDISLSMPNVRELDLSHNFISLNGSNEFKYAYNMLSLNLSHNNISEFYEHGTEDLILLRTLDLSENPLFFIYYEFSFLRNLEHLNLSNSNISLLLTQTFYCLEFLQILDLSHNNFVFLPKGVFAHAVNMQHLDLSHNKLHGIDFGEVGDVLSTYQQCYGNDSTPLLVRPLRMLRTLDLSSNRLERIRSDTFSMLRGLRTLNLSRNAISYYTEDVWLALDELEVLDLSHNQLTSLPSGAFSPCKNLSLLDVSGNLLQSLGTGSGGPFLGLSAVRELDASSNFVAELADGTLDPLARLEQLDLSRNVLRSVGDAAFRALKELRHVNVSDNQLQTLPEELMQNCRVEVSFERNELTSTPMTCSTHDRLWYYARLERAMYWPTAYLPPLPWALLLAAAIIFAAVLNKEVSRTRLHPIVITIETE